MRTTRKLLPFGAHASTFGVACAPQGMLFSFATRTSRAMQNIIPFPLTRVNTHLKIRSNMIAPQLTQVHRLQHRCFNQEKRELACREKTKKTLN